MKHRNRLIAATAVMTCSAAVTTSVDASTSEDADPVRITSLGLCTEVTHWADVNGFFGDEGIAAEFVSTTGGAAGLDAVESGAADVAYVNPMTFLNAVEAGRDLVVVAGAGSSQPDNNGVIVGADSAVESPADLVGHTIGINEIGGLGYVMTRAWIAADGGDPEDAEFVALGFPELVPAVEGGQIDAAQVTANQSAQAEASDNLRVIGNPFYEVIGSIPTAFYVAKRGFVEDSDVADRFTTAMLAAGADFDDPANRDEQFQVMSEFCQNEVDVLEATPYTEQPGTLSVDQFQGLIDVLVEQEALAEDHDAAELITPSAQADSSDDSTADSAPSSTVAG